MKIELTDSERALFSNIIELNKNIAEGRFEFKNRIISGIKMPGIEIISGAMKNVEISASEMTDARLIKTEVTGVDFIEVDLSGSIVKEVTFEHCSFEGVKFGPATISNTTFKNCTFINCNFEGAKIMDSTIVASKLDHVEIADSTVTSSSLRESDVVQLDYYGGFVGNMEVTKNNIGRLGYESLQAPEIVVSDSVIKKLGIARSEMKNGVRIVNCKVEEAISTLGVKTPNLSISQCNDIENTTILQSEIEELSIDCKRIHRLTLMESKTKMVSLKDSEIEIFNIDDTTSFEKGKIINTKIQAFGIIRSTVKGLTIENSSIDEMLVLKKAVLDGMVLKNVTVKPGVEYVEEDVQYINSMKFQIQK